MCGCRWKKIHTNHAGRPHHIVQCIDVQGLIIKVFRSGVGWVASERHSDSLRDSFNETEDVTNACLIARQGDFMTYRR